MSSFYKLKNYRKGKECKKTNCKHYKSYLSGEILRECMECKHSHVSQYVRAEKGEL